MTAQTSIMSEGRTLTSVRESAIHGIGCFAPMPFEAGTLIAEYRGEVIGRDEARSRDNPRSPRFSPYVVHLAGEWFIDGAVRGSDARFLNHSCDPNCEMVRLDDHVLIAARGVIARGAELTIDYDLDDPDFVCRCQASACRGTPARSRRADP
jgi:SET domain-containing protein